MRNGAMAVLASLTVLGVGLAVSGGRVNAGPAGPEDVLTQTSTINALLDGAYDGDMRIGDLLERGDVGIGTLRGLDGELVIVDGEAFQVGATGAVRRVGDDETTPFASVTPFDADARTDAPAGLDYPGLQAVLDAMRPSENLFYAVRATGSFRYVHTRSVPKQEKPYPPLAEVTRNQPEFEMHDVEGVVVGFWCPAFVEGVNVPGYHLHFLSEDRTCGGHLLGLTTEDVAVELDYTDDFLLDLPETEEFLGFDVRAGRHEDLEDVEG